MNWDQYFFELCTTVARKSRCLSRQVGCLIVRNNRVVATGYNGPPMGVPHCGEERFMKDSQLSTALGFKGIDELNRRDIHTTCPRQLLGYTSGAGLEWCHALHAERNAITNAAFLGVETNRCTLYLNNIIPCKDCFGTIINAGIVEVICLDMIQYDKTSEYFQKYSSIKIREFSL